VARYLNQERAGTRPRINARVPYPRPSPAGFVPRSISKDLLKLALLLGSRLACLRPKELLFCALVTKGTESASAILALTSRLGFRLPMGNSPRVSLWRSVLTLRYGNARVPSRQPSPAGFVSWIDFKTPTKARVVVGLTAAERLSACNHPSERFPPLTNCLMSTADTTST
jgi:hypothetical protein